MKIFLEWFLVALLIGYLWAYRGSLNVILAGGVYFVAAGLLGTLARELHVPRKRNEKGPIWLRAVAAMAESEALILAIAYLMFLLSLLNSAVMAPQILVPAAALPIGSWLVYSAVFLWMTTKVRTVAGEEHGFKALPPLFVFINLYIFVATLVPLSILASARRVSLPLAFVSPPALGLLFAALCSASFGLALFRSSALASLDNQTRTWGAVMLIGSLGGAALLQFVSGANWYSYCLSGVVIVGLMAGLLRLWEDYARPARRSDTGGN